MQLQSIKVNKYYDMGFTGTFLLQIYFLNCKKERIFFFF